MVEFLIFMELMFSPKIITRTLTIETSQQVISSNQNQETQQLSKSHHIMVSEMKSILLVTSTNLLLKNLRQISLNMLIMTKKFSDILLDSTQKSQRTLTEDLSFLSIQLTIRFPFSNLLRRILVSLKDHSSREESTRMLTRVWSSLLLVNFQSVEILKSMDTTSTCWDVMITQLNTLLLTLTDQQTLIKCFIKTLFLEI